jgi:hypothetical protein
MTTPNLEMKISKKEPWKAFFDEVEIAPNSTMFVRHRMDDEWNKLSVFGGKKFVAFESEKGATGIPFFFVGTKMQMLFPENIFGTPSFVFTEEAAVNDVRFDVCDVALWMTFVVTNKSDKPVKWSAFVEGDGVRKPTAEVPAPASA